MPLILFIIFASGCSSFNGSYQNTFDQRYRKVVQEQVGQVVSQFEGGSFPYFHWSSPIVQEVLVPAHITNGVLIPEHKELVIIKPGEWVNSYSYPIKTQKENGDDINVSYVHMDDLTALPSGLVHPFKGDPAKEGDQNNTRRMGESDKFAENHKQSN